MNPTRAFTLLALAACAGKSLNPPTGSATSPGSATRPLPGDPACEVPTGVSTTETSDGCYASVLSITVNGAPGNLCSSGQFGLVCQGPNENGTGSPGPDPALGCATVGVPLPLNVSEYCCPCTPGGTGGGGRMRRGRGFRRVRRDMHGWTRRREHRRRLVHPPGFGDVQRWDDLPGRVRVPRRHVRARSHRRNRGDREEASPSAAAANRAPSRASTPGSRRAASRTARDDSSRAPDPAYFPLRPDDSSRNVTTASAEYTVSRPG